MRDRILGTGLDAVAAEDATAVIDVVDLGISFIYPDAFFRRTRIVLGNDINAIRWARGSAQETGDALFLPGANIPFGAWLTAFDTPWALCGSPACLRSS